MEIINAPLSHHMNSVAQYTPDYQHFLETDLSVLLPSNKKENKLQKAKKILGANVEGLPDSTVETIITELQYFLDWWIDDFERQIFPDLGHLVSQ